MSIRSLTALAVERDRAAPGTPALGGRQGTAPLPATAVSADAAPAPADQAIPQTYVDTLTSAIPTEPLAAYTALVGIVTAAIGTDTHGYLPFRWSAYAVFLALIAISVIVSYRVKATTKDGDGADASKGNDRRIPWLELGSALVAGGTWGIAMPGGPLSAAFTGPAEAIATGSTVILGASLVALAAGPLKSGTSVDRASAPQTEPPAAQGVLPPVPA